MNKAHLVRRSIDELLSGLVEGDPVPPERELAARFGVARDTVRQALQELLLDGRIARRGRGTVISKPKLTQPLSLESYTEGALLMGRKPGRILVTWEDITATGELADGLGIPVDEAVTHLERVLLADDEPVGLESAYLSTCRFGPLRETFDPTSSLYAAIRATGVRFGSAHERIETVLGTPREASLLETTTAMPMLRLNRRTLDDAGRPIEVVRSLYRGDRVAFEAHIVNNDR